MVIRRRCALARSLHYCGHWDCDSPAEWIMVLPQGSVIYTCEEHKAPADSRFAQLKVDLQYKAQKLSADTWQYLKSLSECKWIRLPKINS